MTSESEKRHGRVGALRNWRMLAAGLAVVVVAFGCLAGAALADGWYESWDDGNDVNPPLDWEHTPMFSGLYDPSSGNYLLAGQNLQEAITGGLIDDDDEILNGVAAGGDEAVSFFRNVSVRTRARMDGPGGVGVSPFGDLSVPQGYGAVVHNDGYAEISMFTADPQNAGIKKLKEEEFETTFTDLFVQLDSVETEDSNATMSLTFWRPGEPQPAEPQMVVDLSNDDDEDGFPLRPFMNIVPPVGPAGVLFNEDTEEGFEGEGTGTFFWAIAQTAKLINADINRDGEVNGLDVDPFVDVVINGPFDPLADMNSDDEVNGLDVDPFVAAVVGGGAAAAPLNVADVPEPTTLVLALLGMLACIALWRGLRSK